MRDRHSDRAAPAAAQDDARQLADLLAQAQSWADLQAALHRVLAAFSPFHAQLRAPDPQTLEPASGRTLLRVWLPCQRRVDRLMDLEAQSDRAGSARPQWGARIASLRAEMEDRLREEMWSSEGLLDLADEFEHVCGCYLTLADDALRRTLDEARRLHARLFGGLP